MNRRGSLDPNPDPFVNYLHHWSCSQWRCEDFCLILPQPVYLLQEPQEEEEMHKKQDDEVYPSSIKEELIDMVI